MTTWYQTSPRSLVLYEVQVTRQTANNVWIAMHGIERKEKRHSQHADYWPTLDEAVTVLKKQAERQYKNASEEVSEAEAVLKSIADRTTRLLKRHEVNAPTPENLIVL
jgi:hypothetical protein